MRRLVWILIILTISVWLGLQMAKDPGIAFFSYRQWSIEMPLWLALVGLIIALSLLYFIVSIFNSIDFSLYRWSNWLRLRRKYKEADICIGLVQAELQIEKGQYELTLAHLNRLRTMAPKHPLVLKLLEQVYSYLLQSTAQRQEGEKALRAMWDKIPRTLRQQPRLIYCYAQQLGSYPARVAEVSDLINKVLKKSWNADLVKLYELLVAENPVRQLGRAEYWLTLYPEQPILLLTLGRLAIKCQLWGKARHYLEESLKLDKNLEVCLEYGNLLQQLGDSTAAMLIYKNGLHA
jgi:uncharacterized protein HemY